uniref:Uncharacterized protein n=1 Tax=Globisporangium ultimum (strain ATCC 200006 / CBS 805.95 / DAOM BR144) TaxID=431595 RepID=K3WV11_GLOUD
MTSSGPICFGDVVKLYTKADDDTSCVGFLEHKSDQYLLVVPPVKDSTKAKYNEAEFIISPIQCDKPPAKGTPLHYKQSFVLKTSDHDGYSLNNKIKNAEHTIGLQACDVKGEMYVVFEKEGFTVEANVNDGDSELDITVIDSNRIRKNYNKKLTFYTKSKSDPHGGYISCGSKGKPLTFKIVKMAGAAETKKFVQKQIPRRRSTVTMDTGKANEIGRAARVGSNGSDGDALSPTANPAMASPTSVEQEVKPTEAIPPAPETPAATASAEPTSTNSESSNAKTLNLDASTVSSGAVASEAMVPEAVLLPGLPTPVSMNAAPSVTGTPAADMFSGVTLKEAPTEAIAPSTTGKAAPLALAPATNSSAPRKDNETTKSPATAMKPIDSPTRSMSPCLAASPELKQPKHPSTMTATSEAEQTDEKIDANCLGGGNCVVM